MDRLTPGFEVDGLVVRRRIGSGGSGTAYLVHNTRIGRDECMKVLEPSSTSEGPFLWDEARKASASGISGVVTVYSAGSIGNSSWFSMEYAPHGDLRGVGHRLLSDEATHAERLSLILSLLLDAAEALDSLHSLSPPMVHGDIKPGNILVFSGPNGRPQAKLADFGLATAEESIADSSPGTAPVSGTLAYLAPERFSGARPSPMSDRYAFACTAFELLTGHRAFSPDTSRSDTGSTNAIDAYRTAHARSIRMKPSDYAPWLRPVDGVFQAGLSPDPAMRPRSATAFIQEIAARLNVNPGPKAINKRKFPTMALTIGVVAAILIAGSGVLLLGNSDDNDGDAPPGAAGAPDLPSPALVDDESILPIGQGCPPPTVIDSFANTFGRNDELADEHRGSLGVDLPEDCVLTFSDEGTAMDYPPEDIEDHAVLYVFNRTDEITTSNREKALAKATNFDTFKTYSTPISTNSGTVRPEHEYATRIGGLVPGDPQAPSSVCSTRFGDGTLTILEVHYGFQPISFTQHGVGGGTNDRLTSCWGTRQLIETWLDTVN